jgi:hypothetical protein
MFITSKDQHDGQVMFVLVVAVDMPNRLVHCSDKHKGTFLAAYRDTPVAHQIPQNGEYWTIVRRSGHWMMQDRVEDDTEATRTESLNQGDVHMKVPGALRLNDGNLGYTTWESFTANGSQDAFSLSVTPVHDKTLKVYDNSGALILPTTYTLVALTINFQTPPVAGTLVVYYERT